MRKSPYVPSSFAPDRGPAKCFHGRKQILRDFMGYDKLRIVLGKVALDGRLRPLQGFAASLPTS